MKKLIYAAALALMPGFGFAQVSGTVVDTTSNETVPGAVITIQNSFLTAVTDIEGKFSFKGLKQTAVKIQITHIGYETKILEVPVPSEKLDIVLTKKSYL